MLGRLKIMQNLHGQILNPRTICDNKIISNISNLYEKEIPVRQLHAFAAE